MVNPTTTWLDCGTKPQDAVDNISTNNQDKALNVKYVSVVRQLPSILNLKFKKYVFFALQATFDLKRVQIVCPMVTCERNKPKLIESSRLKWVVEHFAV